jgi:hypothetical protein
VIDMADAPVRHEATDEELRAAWRVCRTRAWPESFEETMQDPLRALMVQTTAVGLARKRTRPTQPTGTLDVPVCRIHDAACEEVQPSRRCANCPHRPPPARHFAPPPGYVDRKRLAAGDRDED